MVELTSLLIPILLSAVIVFIVSTIIHMFLPYHRKDFVKVPSEDEVMEALRKFDIPPGDYVIPCAGSPEVMRSPEFKEKTNKGPVAFVTVLKSGPLSMTGSLIQWFIYCIIVGTFAAYIAGRALEPGANYIAVFRFVGGTAFIGYTLALLQNSIWYKRRWCTTIKSMFDGLIYALFTAGTFGWLWPSL
jgi:FtsH-binding integral membrane protein